MVIGVFYAALRAELEYRQLEMCGWQGDHLLARNAYDRVPIAGQREPEPVLPDATFLMNNERFFVEIDRGTRPLRSWQEKVRAYEAYQAHQLLAARYATDHFRVLVVAPTLIRVRRIAEEIVKITRDVSPRYLLMTEERVHPTTIRRGWLGVDAVQWEPKQVVDRVVLMPAVTLGQRALWENAA